MTLNSNGIPERFRANAADLVEHLCANYVDGNQLYYVISLDGHIDEARLVRAARLTLDAEPVLGCMFVGRRRHPYFERRDDLDRLELCTVVETDDIEGELLRGVVTRKDSCRDPFVETTVLRSYVDTLCVRLDHIVADGTGFQDYVELLCSTYRVLGEIPEYEPAPNVRGDRTMRQVFKRFKFIDRFRNSGSEVVAAETCAFPWKGEGASCPAFAVRYLNANTFKAIRSYGQEYKATVNDIVLTSFCRAVIALAEAGPGEQVSVQVPVNLRRYLPGKRAGAVCNLAGQTTLTVSHEPGEPFAATLARVRDRMNGAKAANPGLAPWALLEPAFKVAGFPAMESMLMRIAEKRLRSMLYVTNIGPMTGERLDFGDVQIKNACVLSSIVFPPAFGLIVSSFDEVLNLTVGYSDAHVNREVVERLLDLMERELKETALTGCQVLNLELAEVPSHPFEFKIQDLTPI